MKNKTLLLSLASLTLIILISRFSANGAPYTNNTHGNPHRWRELAQKVVRTPAENAEWENLLRNSAELEMAANRVLKINSNSDLAKDERERLDAILLLMRALEWKANPSYNQVINLIKGIIRAPLNDTNLPLVLRRSAIVDRMELYIVLRENYPFEADKIERELTLPWQKKMIHFANNFYSHKSKGGNL